MKNPHHHNRKALGWSFHAAGLLAVVAMLTAFYQLSYAQMADQCEAHCERTQQLERLLSNGKSIRRKHHSLREELDQLEQETASMRKRLPLNLEKEQFESSVRLAAHAAKFRLQEAAWDTPESTPTHSRAEVTVSGRGSFASICGFLDKVHQLARVTKIINLELATDQESASYPLEVTFVLVYGIESNDTNKTGEVL